MKKKRLMGVVMFALAFLVVAQFVSAGVGIKWNQESSMVPENTNTCLTYYVYNPWDKDTYAEIVVSDDFKDIISSASSEKKLIPAHTSSSEAMPIEFCFKTPRVYERDCWIGNSLICKQDCTEDMKVYSGKVIVQQAKSDSSISSAGGSATQMSVSAPLKIRVKCVPHSRNYSLIYIVVALIAGLLLFFNIRKEKKKSKKGAKGSRLKKK